MRIKRGQSTIEIVVLIIVIAAAVLTMNRYLRRTIMGRIRQEADQIGEQFSVTGVENITISQSVQARYKTTQTLGGEELKQYAYRNITSTRNIELGALNEEEFFEP